MKGTALPILITIAGLVYLFVFFYKAHVEQNRKRVQWIAYQFCIEQNKAYLGGYRITNNDSLFAVIFKQADSAMGE
jgi:hypothetical protein